MKVDTSFVVIAFCEEAQIAQSLRSIQLQDGASSFEIVVVDDGSTDKTGTIVKRLSKKDSRIRLIQLPTNVGRGLARATGISAAQGTHIALVDADITLPSDWLARCLSALPGHSGAGGIAVPDGDIAVVARITGVALRPRPGSRAVAGSNAVFKAAVLKKVTLPETPLGEDFRLISRLEQSGHRFVTVIGLTVAHHEHKGFWRAVGWLFASGVDATRLFREFRILRVPDVAGLLFAVSVAASAAASVLGILASWLLPAAVLLGVWAGHSITRFRVTPKPLRFVAAVILNFPLISAYLIGRLVGVVRLMVGRL